MRQGNHSPHPPHQTPTSGPLGLPEAWTPTEQPQPLPPLRSPPCARLCCAPQPAAGLGRRDGCSGWPGSAPAAQVPDPHSAPGPGSSAPVQLSPAHFLLPNLLLLSPFLAQPGRQGAVPKTSFPSGAWPFALGHPPHGALHTPNNGKTLTQALELSRLEVWSRAGWRVREDTLHGELR